jgi:hypothetical protein
MHFSARIIRDWAVETMKRISLERKDLKKCCTKLDIDGKNFKAGKQL